MWFTRKKKWCCWHIKDLYNGRYDQSLFVFVKPPVPNLWTKHTFWLAFRSVTYDDLVSELPLGVRDDVALTLSSSQRIDYGPWCGRNLSRYYRRRCSELVDPKICEEFKTAVEQHRTHRNSTAKQVPSSPHTSWICPHCQSEVPSDFAVCWSCGASPDGHVDPNFKSQVEDDSAARGEPVYEPLQFSLRTLLLIMVGVGGLFAVVRVWSPANDKYIREIVNASLFLLGCGVAGVFFHRAARKRLAMAGQALVDAGIVLLMTAVVLNLVKAILQ